MVVKPNVCVMSTTQRTWLACHVRKVYAQTAQQIKGTKKEGRRGEGGEKEALKRIMKKEGYKSVCMVSR